MLKVAEAVEVRVLDRRDALFLLEFGGKHSVLELLEHLDEAGGYVPEGSLSIPAGRNYNAPAGE